MSNELDKFMRKEIIKVLEKLNHVNLFAAKMTVDRLLHRQDGKSER